MFYSLVNFPNIEKSQINIFRRKFDPYVDLIDAQITVIFPVPGDIGKDLLVNHISDVLKSWKPFRAKVKGLERAWDNWLFLLLKEGNQEIIKLHDELYNGILKSHLRSDIEFIPHVAIGLFVKDNYDLRDPKEVKFDRETYNRAFRLAGKFDTGQDFLFNNLTLVEIDDQFKKAKKIKEFYLD